MAARTNTNTQIRNMYCDASYLNMKFYNTNLSFQMSRANGKNQNGMTTYDLKNSLMTTVDYTGAFSLYQTASHIISGKMTDVSVIINCAGGAQIKIERKIDGTGVYRTTFEIMKNGQSCVFTFPIQQITVIENGQPVQQYIESGLGVFAKTVDGYLTGINADRHLDKLTEDFAKQNENNGNNFQQNKFNGNNNNGYKKPYKKQYNNNYQNNNQGNYQNNNQQNSQWGQQQSMSSFELPM